MVGFSEGLGVNQGGNEFKFYCDGCLAKFAWVSWILRPGGLGLVQKGSCNYWKQYQYQIEALSLGIHQTIAYYISIK